MRLCASGFVCARLKGSLNRMKKITNPLSLKPEFQAVSKVIMYGHDMDLVIKRIRRSMVEVELEVCERIEYGWFVGGRVE